MEKEQKQEQKYGDKIIRIASKDISGGLKIYTGLTKIKGISWGLANVICKRLGIDKNRKIGSLSKEEIDKINKFIKNPEMPNHLFNRKFDIKTGENRYIVGSDLELEKEFDIGRLKKIKSYKGYRHSAGLPVRGQRTKSNFRRNKKKGVGIKKKGSKK